MSEKKKRPESPASHHDETTSDRTARQCKVDEHLQGIVTTLQIGTTDTCVSFPLSPIRKYGSDVSAISRAVADAMERCPQAFTGLTVTATSLRGQEERVRELTGAKEWVSTLNEKISSEQRTSIGKLAHDTDLALAAINATLSHPGSDPRVRDVLRIAAQPALSLVEARRGSIQATRLNTLALKTETDTAKRVIETKEAEVERLSRENKILLGTEPPSSSLTIQPAPAAPRKATRARRKTSR